jgi:hypothetical protein
MIRHQDSQLAKPALLLISPANGFEDRFANIRMTKRVEPPVKRANRDEQFGVNPDPERKAVVEFSGSHVERTGWRT